jgi:dTMP kinase
MEWLPLLTQMSDFALGGMKPDITILLDCPPQVGLERAGKIKHLDRFESEQLPFHERVRKGYLTHITDYPEHYILDATKSIEEVHEEVMKIIVRK